MAVKLIINYLKIFTDCFLNEIYYRLNIVTYIDIMKYIYIHY